MRILLTTQGMAPRAFRRWLAAIPAIMAWADGDIVASEIGEKLAGLDGPAVVLTQAERAARWARAYRGDDKC